MVTGAGQGIGAAVARSFAAEGVLASDEALFINAATIVIDGDRSVLYHE